jgi:hypothetical protein
MSGGALDASVTLDEVLTIVGARRVPLAPELAGYLVLEIAEHADPNGGDVDPKSVFVGEEGTVALVTRRGRANGNAEESIRAALGKLLEASGSQTPALAAASKRKNGAGLLALTSELEAALIPVNRAAGRRALARLAREVKRVTLGVGRHTLPSSSSLRSGAEGSSAPSPQRDPTVDAASPGPAGAWSKSKEPVPPLPGVPPSARQRSASRFSPEEDPTTARSRIPGQLLNRATPDLSSEMPTIEFVPSVRAPTRSEADVDALIAQFGVSGGTEQQHARALKALAGLDPTPPAPPELMRRHGPATEKSPPSGELDAQALLATKSQPPGAAAPALSRSVGRASEAPGTGDERQLPTQPSQLKARATLPSVATTAPRHGWGAILGLALITIAAGSYAVWQLRPAGLARRTPGTADSRALPAPREALPACTGTLVVADVPPHAEVLLREGQAPVDVQRMPVGARLEFVATAEGYAPKRVVVPAGAGWDPGPDGKPRFETAVQLDPSRGRSSAGETWPAGEPGSAVGGEGPPGTVHVVATPRGAEVWMLAGIGPEARIEHLRCDLEIEVLVAGPTTYRKRLHVVTSDFVPDDAPRVASAKTPARIATVSAK